VLVTFNHNADILDAVGRCLTSKNEAAIESRQDRDVTRAVDHAPRAVHKNAAAQVISYNHGPWLISTVQRPPISVS